MWCGIIWLYDDCYVNGYKSIFINILIYNIDEKGLMKNDCVICF